MTRTVQDLFRLLIVIRRTAMAFALCGGVVYSAVAAETPGNPTLRIESVAAHSAVIGGLAVSIDGSLIATASNDRTVRLWSMPGLRPVRTIFLPAGPDNQGAAYTVALSPDSKMLITTGWTGSWEGKDGPWCFYVIGVEQGNIARTICDLPSRANHVAYSLDGKYLAFALKAGKGLRVYRTADYSVAFSEPYPETSTWVEFDRAGRVITTCYDGKVRLYDKDFALIASQAMPEGRRPDSLSFSPDGTQIAVGYDEPEAQEPRWPAAVDVISSANLSVLFRPDLAGVNNGALWRVAWSADGSYLLATGTWRTGNRFSIRRWADGGKGKPRDFPGAASLILRLRGLPSGGFVFVGENPYIGVIGAEGHLDAERQIPMADYTNIGESFGISNDGLSVQFAFEPSGESLAFFSLPRRLLVNGKAPPNIEMSYPVTEMSGLDVRDWSRGYRPTLNGEPLKMTRAHEHALSLTFAPDGKSFLLGTVWNVIRYDASGNILWATQVPFNVRGVVVTKDGRLAVAAIGDGTIRWYAMDTGQELLAFFPHKDHRRWVAWTPAGYYMASVDGDSLIGWTVNRGRDRVADFFEAGQFRHLLYRPNVVLRTLAESNETKAVREANVGYGPHETRPVADFVKSDLLKRQPPIVSIIAPADNSIVTQDEVEIEYSVRSPSGLPISSVSALIDGRAVSGQAREPANVDPKLEISGKIKVKLPGSGEFAVSIVAVARVGSTDLENRPTTIHLRRSGVTIAPRAPNPTLYAVVVGIGEYGMKDLRLKGDFPARDAGKFAEEFERQQGRAFSRVVAHVLTDKDATNDKILRELDWLQNQGDSDDVALFYFSGHGNLDHLLPVNFDGHETVTGIDKSVVIRALRQVRGRKVLFIDACQAAGGLLDLESLVTEAKSSRNGIIVVVSSNSDQPSAGEAQSNSYFTTAVLEGLEGKAARAGDNEVETAGLNAYLVWRVPDLSGGKQNSAVYMPFNAKPLRLSVPQNSSKITSP